MWGILNFFLYQLFTIPFKSSRWPGPWLITNKEQQWILWTIRRCGYTRLMFGKSDSAREEAQQGSRDERSDIRGMAQPRISPRSCGLPAFTGELSVLRAPAGKTAGEPLGACRNYRSIFA